MISVINPAIPATSVAPPVVRRSLKSICAPLLFAAATELSKRVVDAMPEALLVTERMTLASAAAPRPRRANCGALVVLMAWGVDRVIEPVLLVTVI